MFVLWCDHVSIKAHSDVMATTFSVGDVVRFHRGEYSHVALYVGNHHVIHLWSPSSGRAFAVRIDSIRHVQNSHQSRQDLALALSDLDNDNDTDTPQQWTRELDAKMLRDHSVQPFDGEEVVRRARTRLGETRYDYLSYNCEHFVTWARYGVGASPQATSHTNQVIAGALLGAAVGGMAGLVVGGMISFFSKMNALSASSSGVDNDEVGSVSTHIDSDVSDYEDAVDGTHVTEDTEQVSAQQYRRQERERLLEDVAAMRLDDAEATTSEFEAWAVARHERRAQANARRYSDDRHRALATRLADGNLLCGICFYDLQLTRVVAFPCDHLTCAKCYEALVPNTAGHKACPYCREHIDNVQVIHRSTKLAARHRISGHNDP